MKEDEAPTVASNGDSDANDGNDGSSSSNEHMYSREEDFQKLLGAYERRRERHLVMVVGQRGNGKTSLIRSLEPRVRADDGYFLIGRYDGLEFPEPFAPFIAAAKQFLELLLQQGQEGSLERVRTALTRVMDLSEMQSLASVIPSLSKVIQLSALTKGKTSTHYGRSSFLVTYCNFMRAISHPEHPIVLVLDDCHASDPGSLEVFKILVADQKIQGLLCIVAFRPVGVKHPFSMLLRYLESAGVKFVPILPSPITADSILSWMLHYDLSNDIAQCNEWSQTIQKGTKGNALSVKLCLAIMEQHQDVFLQDPTSTPLKVGGEVHQLFELLFMMLSQNCQLLLKIASCMGDMEIDVDRLRRTIHELLKAASGETAAIVNKTMVDNLREYLQEATNAGVVERMAEDGNSNGDDGIRFKFANAAYKDCIYQSTSAMPSSKDNSSLAQQIHNAIGKIYRQDVEQVGIYKPLAHLQHARQYLSPKGKEAFAKLCLQAGLDTNSWTELVSAIHYLDLGIELLDDHKSGPKAKWKSQYELSLALLSASADVYNSSSDFEKMDARLVEILDNAKNASDKLKAYKIQMKSLSSRTLHEEAVALGLKVLPKLGEHIFTKRTLSWEAELSATKKILDPLMVSDEQDQQMEQPQNEVLASMKVMSDEKKIGVMTVLNLLLASCFISQQGDLVHFIACRMVAMTIKSGICSALSAVGFATLGCQMCSMGDIKMGTWCSELAMKIVDMVNSNKDMMAIQDEGQAWKGRVMAIHWGIVGRYTKPWKQCQEPLKIAYRLCMEAGDTEFALISPVLSVFNMLVAGGALSNVAAAMKSVYQLLHKRNQDMLMRILRPFFQTVLNLMGATTETNPLVLSGSIMNEEEEFKYAKQKSSKKLFFSLYLCQAEMAFLLHKFKRAQGALDKIRDLHGTDMIFSSLAIKTCFLDAMVCIALAWDAHRDEQKSERESGKRKKYYLAKARQQLEDLEDLSEFSPTTVLQKVYIVRAEFRAVDGFIDEAMDLFKQAMHHAEQNGCMSDRTLACERAGLALRSCGREDDALDYLEDCCAYYREWGAIVKVNHVKGNVIPQAIFEWDEE